eukprot:gene8644-13369_t
MERSKSSFVAVEEVSKLDAWFRWLDVVGENGDQRLRKRLFVVLGPLTLLLPAVRMMNGIELTTITAFSPVVISILFSFMYIVTSKRAPPWLAVFFAAGCTISVSLLDLAVASKGTSQFRLYPCFVLVLDTLIVCRTHTNVITLFVVIACSWMLLTALEDFTRFGLYDIPGLTVPQSERKLVECDMLPCPLKVGEALSRCFNAAVVLVLDFLLTRGFALQVQEEKSRMRRSISVARDIARALADFDLGFAEKELIAAEQAGHLPNEFRVVLETLLGNLQTYQPYLPHSCLPCYVDGTEPSSTSVVSVNEEGSEAMRMSKLSTQYRMARCAGVACVTANIRDSLVAWGRDENGFLRAFEATLAIFIDAVVQNRGVSDSLLGDHITASFNAFRPCHSYAVAACRAVCSAIRQPGELSLNVAIASGKAACGVAGCGEMRRPVIFGSAPLLANAYERQGRARDLAIICDQPVQTDVWMFFDMRMLPLLVTIEKKKDRQPTRLYSINPFELPETEQEWMYAVDESASPALAYNEIVRLYLDGEASKALALCSK